jgi:hypothetical protein
VIDRIAAGAEKITVAAERPRREPREPQPLLEQSDQRLVVDRLPGVGEGLKKGEDTEELFVSGKVARHVVKRL